MKVLFLRWCGRNRKGSPRRLSLPAFIWKDMPKPRSAWTSVVGQRVSRKVRRFARACRGLLAPFSDVWRKSVPAVRVAAVAWYYYGFAQRMLGALLKFHNTVSGVLYAAAWAKNTVRARSCLSCCQVGPRGHCSVYCYTYYFSYCYLCTYPCYCCCLSCRYFCCYSYYALFVIVIAIFIVVLTLLFSSDLDSH
jgi:hypothetical protein